MNVIDADNHDLSFVPDGYLVRRAQRRADRLCGGLLAIAIVGVSAAFVIAERSTQRLRDEHATVSAEFDREAARLQRLDAMRRQHDVLARRAKLAASLVERAPRGEVLTELRDLLPADATLSEVNLTSRVRPPAPKTPQQILTERQNPAAETIEPKVYDVALRVGGIAVTDKEVADYLTRLGASRFFTDVNLLYSNDLDVGGQPLRRFAVELVVRSDPLPASSPNEPLVTTETQLLR